MEPGNDQPTAGQRQCPGSKGNGDAAGSRSLHRVSFVSYGRAAPGDEAAYGQIQ